MKTFLSSLFLCFVFTISAQNDKITKSYLIGNWKQGLSSIENGQRIQIYIRAKNDAISYFGITTFGSNDSYALVYSNIIRRCGNDRRKRLKNIYSSYYFDKEKQQVNFFNKNNEKNSVWNIVWIDDNRFGRITSKD